MLDKPWMWTDSGQSLDLGFALPMANCPPITHPPTIGQILDKLDIFWTEFELELCINRALIPNTYQLDKLQTNIKHRQSLACSLEKFCFCCLWPTLGPLKAQPWPTQGPAMAHSRRTLGPAMAHSRPSHGPLKAQSWLTLGPISLSMFNVCQQFVQLVGVGDQSTINKHFKLCPQYVLIQSLSNICPMVGGWVDGGRLATGNAKPKSRLCPESVDIQGLSNIPISFFKTPKCEP